MSTLTYLCCAVSWLEYLHLIDKVKTKEHMKNFKSKLIELSAENCFIFNILKYCILDKSMQY